MITQADQQDEEEKLHALAQQLEFKLERQGARFALRRTVDVSRPVHHDNLTAAEAQDILNTWKLRGFHGG